MSKLTNLKELQDMSLEEIWEYVNEVEQENAVFVESITGYNKRMDELVQYSLAQKENANSIALGVHLLMSGDPQGAEILTGAMNGQMIISQNTPMEVLKELKKESLDVDFHENSGIIH